jgi:hypothetical protein
MSGFLVGTDLVEFDRRDLPIYATPETRWADAGCDVVSYGVPLDRLFGEPGEVFVSGTTGGGAQTAIQSLVDDPLVTLAGLADGLALPASAEEQTLAALDDAAAMPAPSPEIAVVYDFTSEPWADWMIDHHPG